MRSSGTICKYDTGFVPEYSSFHGMRNPPGEGGDDRSSQASRLFTEQAGVANLEVAGHRPLLANALERLPGRRRPQIIQVAKATLERNLRGVLSQLNPEEVNQDKLRFAEKLLEEAEHDLSRLGLILDVLKIPTVADDVGYLNSLGRKQTAALDKSARVAEAQAHAEAAVREAENNLSARLEQVKAAFGVDLAKVVGRLGAPEEGMPAPKG